MARRGKKKATRKEASGDGEAAKDPREAATGPAELSDRTGSRSGDWSTVEPVAGEEEALVDADPALETEDRPREFSARDNPFESREPAREMDPSAPVASTDEALEEEFDPAPTHGMTQPPLGDEDTALSEALGMEGGLVHLVDREDMGKGVQNDPSAYAQGPGKPGLVEGATPAEDLRDTFLDPAARAGQARASAEDVLRARGMVETGDWSASGAMVEERDPRLPAGSRFLDAVLVGQAFPATKESIACALAQEAWRNGGPFEAFHDLVVQLDQGLFQDLPDLKRALGDRFVWESAHGPSRRGGPHGR